MEHQGLYFYNLPAGRFEGSTFAGEWDSIETGSGMHYTGHFRAVLNPVTLQIQSWSAESHWIFSSPGQEYTYICEGGVVNLTRSTDDTLEYELLGAAPCGPRKRVYVRQLVDGKVRAEVFEYQCDAGSSLGIRFLSVHP